MAYERWYIDHMSAFAPAAAYVGRGLQSSREFPPRMNPGSFPPARKLPAANAP
jgi:hypothetical protein